MLRLNKEFYLDDVLNVAPALLGKSICRKFPSGELKKFIITEVEAYKGNTDLACHASKGITPRTRIMFQDGGVLYVYLIYGMYWMLNIVTGKKNDASAILIRGIKNITGPGKIGKLLKLDQTFYGENLQISNRIWFENSNIKPEFKTMPRIGIQYAGEPWISKPWRYIALI